VIAYGLFIVDCKAWYSLFCFLCSCCRCVAACSGAAQAAVIAYGLFIFSSKVTNIIANSDLPNGYTVRTLAAAVGLNH
jgi:hypothetical protein